MTFVMSYSGRNSIWMVADRRISYPGRRPPRDDALKVVRLSARDGDAIIGYAGLGATPRGTEPADWVSNVLRGRNLTIEGAVALIRDAAVRELPSHLVGLTRNGFCPSHAFLIPAFSNGKVRLYTIDVVVRGPGKVEFHAASRGNTFPPGTHHPVPIGLTGSGAPCLLKDKKGRRELRRLIKACDRGKVPPQVVADYFAKLNLFAHENTPDGTVGPRCVVLWKCKGKRGSGRGGYEYQYYDGTTRESHANPIKSFPMIANGIDMRSMVRTIMPRTLNHAVALRKGEISVDDYFKRVIAENEKWAAETPSDPDEKLR